MQHLHWTLSDEYAVKLDPLLRQTIRTEEENSGSRLVRFAGLGMFRRGASGLPVLLETACPIDDRLAETLFRRHRLQLKRKLKIINCGCARVSSEQVRRLAEEQHVLRIHYDRPVRALLDFAAPVSGAPSAWQAGLFGRGIGVAVIDTGIYPHPDLLDPNSGKSRIIAFHDLIHNKSSAYDDNGHGTHVAGIAAGNGSSSDGRYRGMAPGSSLIGVKALDGRGSGSLSLLLESIQWVVDHKDEYAIRVLNLSLGAQSVLPCREDPVCRAVEEAWRAGIVVCAAAGNEGPEPGTISTPGISNQVITVGAFDDERSLSPEDDHIASFSSRGPVPGSAFKPDLLCPGVNIVSLRSPGSLLDRMNPSRSPYLTLSGTSMATPVCSGIAALLLEQNRARTPAEVKRLLLRMTRSLGLNRNDQGHGALDTRRFWQETGTTVS